MSQPVPGDSAQTTADHMSSTESAGGRLAEKVANDPGDAESCVELGRLLLSANRPAEAETLLSMAVRRAPGHAGAHRDLAVLLQSRGQAEAALEHFREAIRLDPADPAANFHLGSLHGELGQWKAAAAHLETARKGSDSPAIANNLANALVNLRRPVDARLAIERALERNPDFALGWVTLGTTFSQLKQRERAAAAFSRALEIQPDFAEAKLNLAICKHSLGDYRAALDLFRGFDADHPDHPAALLGLCKTLQALAKYKESLTVAERLTRLCPDSSENWKYLAVTLERLRKYKKALEAVERALLLNENDPALHLITANCHTERRNRKESLASIATALRHMGADTKIGHMIGEILESMKMYDEAVAVYRQILTINPSDGPAESRILDISLTTCDWSRYGEFCDKLIGGVEQSIRTDVPLKFDVFNLQALPVDYPFICRAARHHSKHIERAAAQLAAPHVHAPRRRKAGERIRVGYALPYTWKHSLPIVLKEVVEGHDRDRFELVGFCTTLCPGTDFSREYRRSFDRFIDLPNGAPKEAARLIREQEIDVLIDVAGLTGMNCMNIMALRPAPVQAHFLGYSITTGAGFIDYIITDRHYIPPEWADHNTEKLVYLPDTFMAVSHEEAVEKKASRRGYHLPRNAFVFANFNHPCKFEPKIFAAWMEILSAVPDSVLWFGAWAPPTQKNLRREAEARGIDGKRLVFSKIVERNRHLARLKLADLALDNLYHGGGITTVDALWVGLPVLSILGNTPGARLGATLLSAAGMPETVTPDLDTYVRTAIELAHDRPRLDGLRRRLERERDTCALFDMTRYRGNLEAAYKAMWRNHESGHPPRHIDLADSAGDPDQPE